MQNHDECRLVHLLLKVKHVKLTEQDTRDVLKLLLLPSMTTVTQYASIVWDFAKYTTGDFVELYSQDNTPWYGRLDAILAHVIEGLVLQAVLKITWFNNIQRETDHLPAKYKLSDSSDIQQPQSIIGNILVIPTFDNPDEFFIQPHFTRYYSRYVKGVQH